MTPIPPPFGGIATWTNSIMKWNKDHHYETHIVDTSKGGGNDRAASHQNNIVQEIRRTCRIIANLMKFLKGSNISVVHINSAGEFPGIGRDYLAALIAKGYRKKVIVQFHCDISYYASESKLTKSFVCLLSKAIDQVWVLNAQSESFIHSLNHQYAVKKIPNFIDADIISNHRTFPSKISKVAYLGSVSYAKGFKEIMHVAQKMPDINFYLIGPITQELQNKQALPNVIFTGSKTREEAIGLLREMDVFLFPSYKEGFSIVILEAMAQGLPIITTPVGANKEVIGESGGFIVEVGDWEEIVLKMEQLEERQVRQKMSDFNLDRVKQNYLSSTILKRIFDEYEQLIHD